MIRSNRLIRFKQFEDTTVQLRPFSILMGENNSGKTTTLQAIWLALSSLHQGKLIECDDRRGITKVSKSGYYMSKIPFTAEGDYHSLFYNRVSRRGQAYDETSGALIEITDNKSNSIRIHLREIFNNMNFKVFTPSNELASPELQNYEPLYISGFLGLQSQEERMFPATLDERSSSGRVSSIVRNIILDLKLHDEEKYRLLDSILENELGIRIKDIHFIEDSELYVFSEYEELRKASSVGLEFNSCGSGILQILQIVSVVLRYCPEKTKVVLIDEPDAHLHNNLQVKFCNILMRIQQRLGIQIILSTHSTAIIQNADPENVIPILATARINTSLTNEQEVQQSIVDRLDAYELGKAKISGKIAFFEDSNLSIFKKMADVTHIDCFSGVNTIPVISGRGKDDKLPFNLKPILMELLGRNIEIHIIRDSDGINSDTRRALEEYAEANSVVLHILSKYEIENYILDATVIHRSLISEPRNEGKEIPSVEEIDRKIEEALYETIKGGIYKYSTALTDVLYKVKHNLLGDRDYKTDTAEHEADSIYKLYYEHSGDYTLSEIGMGKQALSIINKWLNSERGLKISKKAIVECLHGDDVSDEMRDILRSLQSGTLDVICPEGSENYDAEGAVQCHSEGEMQQTQISISDYLQ